MLVAHVGGQDSPDFARLSVYVLCRTLSLDYFLTTLLLARRLVFEYRFAHLRPLPPAVGDEVPSDHGRRELRANRRPRGCAQPWVEDVAQPAREV